jgi:KaiC/GvpD/RAD55 family RecA-like ATPase
LEARTQDVPTASPLLGRLPPEVLQFFSNPGGHSLLIKGQAGTGKTTFALQLLESLFGFERNFYLSSRVSDRTLFTQFPWLVERERTERLLSASRQFLSAIHGPEGTQAPEAPPAGGKSDLRHAKVFLRELTVLKGAPSPDVVDRTELTRVGGMFDPQETPEVEEEEGPRDFSAYHSLMVDFDSDMPEIERAYERVENALPNQICVAIDSIEALAEKYGIPATRIVTMLQKDLVENTNTHVVIVIEAEGPTPLDYLVDGVVTLQFRRVAERQIREIAIQKLRGCVLKHPRYAYTLAGGRLTALLPAAIDLAGAPAPWEVVQAPSPALLSSGSPDLDALIGGGYHRGTVNLLEVGKGVPNDVVTMVGLNVAANFLALGHPVFWLPTRDLTGPKVRSAMMAHIEAAAVDGNLRVVEISAQPGREHPAWLVPAERDRISDYLRWDMIRHLVKAGRPPALHITSYDALESRGSPATEDLSEHYASIKEQGNVDLSIVKSSVDVLHKVADFATVHLRLESIDGTIVLMGEKPHTGVFHLGLPPRGHAPRMQLTPAV